MIALKFEKIYKDERKAEPCKAAVPFKRGLLKDCSAVYIADGENIVPSQVEATALWDDGSVKWLLVDFLADLPGNAAKEFILHTESKPTEFKGITIERQTQAPVIDTGSLRFKLQNNGKQGLFEYVEYQGRTYTEQHLEGPFVTDENGVLYSTFIDSWEIISDGGVRTTVVGKGKVKSASGVIFHCETEITVFAGKPWLDIAYRVLNLSPSPKEAAEMFFKVNLTSVKDVKTCVANSNYRTKYEYGDKNTPVEKTIDSKWLLYEANEHMPEVMYGVFFADWNDGESGVCATIYQAHQNYPKALAVDGGGITIKIIPQGVEKIVFEPGMARQQRFALFFHQADQTMYETNSRCIMYQMPDKPTISPKVFEEAEVFENLFVKNKIPRIELELTLKAERRARAFGMMHWGDAPDMNYTMRGRGDGDLVWTNNEYDFPHACALMYARTGLRCYLDGVIPAARHWIDVDICHYSDNPLHIGGHWMHTAGHVKKGVVTPSHEWVEGLLDYYHLTGDKAAYESALGIGENILRLLDLPEYNKKGEINARETGWALRTLTALYNETYDAKWLEKCDRIVGHFEEWKNEYGLWLAPYTDNAAIRVVFMISIAVGSLMRYYRVRPQEKIRSMILEAMDDLIENAMLETGLFYYKELPGLKITGANTIILEALAYAYELTGDIKYIKHGIATFEFSMGKNHDISGRKIAQGGAVIMEGTGPKIFAQSFMPTAIFYKAAAEAGLLT